MRIVSIPYAYVNLKIEDDWLALDPPAMSKDMLSEDEIRQYNTDFNYKHYTVFYEEIEGKKDDVDGESDIAKKETKTGALKEFTKLVSEKNLLTKLWDKVEIDSSFYNNYE